MGIKNLGPLNGGVKISLKYSNYSTKCSNTNSMYLIDYPIQSIRHQMDKSSSNGVQNVLFPHNPSSKFCLELQSFAPDLNNFLKKWKHRVKTTTYEIPKSLKVISNDCH